LRREDEIVIDVTYARSSVERLRACFELKGRTLEKHNNFKDLAAEFSCKRISSSSVFVGLLNSRFRVGRSTAQILKEYNLLPSNVG